MNNTVRISIATAILSLTTALSAMAMNGLRVKANVPFAFTAGRETFPAGQYVFIQDIPESPGLLAIQSPDGHRHGLVLAQAGPSTHIAKESKVVFERYGDRSFLSQVWVAGTSTAQIIPDKEIHRELASSGQPHETVTVAARKG